MNPSMKPSPHIESRRVTSMYIALLVTFGGILIAVANHSFTAIMIQALLGLTVLAVNWAVDPRT